MKLFSKTLTPEEEEKKRQKKVNKEKKKKEKAEAKEQRKQNLLDNADLIRARLRHDGLLPPIPVKKPEEQSLIETPPTPEEEKTSIKSPGTGR